MADVLKGVSDDLAGTVEAASPGIVRVDARRRLPATGIVWSADGLIVTSHHVVERDEEITIGLHNGESVEATLVGRDPSTDVAVLRTQAKLDVPNWGDGGDLRVGHLVLALGRPGKTVQATLGVVSALGPEPSEIPVEETRRERRRRGRHGRLQDVLVFHTPFSGQLGRYLQTDVVMYPGFSGGPLVDAAGRVQGINTSALLRGISLTIPTTTVRRVAESLLSHGRIRRGYLGVGAQPVKLPDALAQELDQDTGLLLVSVESDSPAERAGLMIGDIIVGLDGYGVGHLEELLALLGGERVGKEVTVGIMRGGQRQDVRVTVGERS